MRSFVKAAAAILCIALPLLLIPVRAAEPLPATLTDEAFWKTITDFSEEGGYFRFENFLSNELGFQLVIPQLKEITQPGGVYLGVGPEQNFTYIAVLQPRIAFIIDIRRQNMLELMMYRAFFELSPDRADFLSHLFARKRPPHLDAQSTPEELFASYDGVRADPLLFKKYLEDAKDVLVKHHKFALSDEDLSSIAYVYRVFMESGPDLDYQAGGGFGGGGSPTYMDLMTMTDGQGKNRSYLGSEEAYRTVRDMEMKNLIVPLVGDFGGPKAIRTVAQYLKEHDAKVSTFYLSNVEQYLFQDGGARRFYGNVATLPIDSSSQFIRTANNGNVRGQFRGFGMRFVTLLSPISDVLNALQDGRIRYYDDVLRISHQ
jgi:hypothetical protein